MEMQSSLQYFHQKSSWFTVERRGWVAAVVFAGAVGFGFGNGHTTQGAIQHVSQQLGNEKATVKQLKTKDIPALKSLAGCESWRADVATSLAERPVIVNPSEIPGDCPHPAATK
jgi:hypothetical protein